MAELSETIDRRYVVILGWWRHNEYDYDQEWIESQRWNFDSDDAREEWLCTNQPKQGYEYQLKEERLVEFRPEPYRMWI